MMKTILYVEDQMELRAIHTLYLERHGYRVITAEDGATALRVAAEQNPDLILMDCALPVVDGIVATELLRQVPRTADTPVVLLTAMSFGAVGRRAREAGCSGFIHKPCTPRRLLEEVESWIGPAADDN
jgi:two-component system, cell cycle response regulator DivK